MAYEDQCQQGLKPKYDCLLFDVDDTLYPRSSGLLEEVTKNIQEYMIQKLGIEETEASQMNGVLYKSYGTSMAGLKAIGYDFDNDDYHRFVHGRLPYERLKPDHVLRNLLLSLPIRKVIFSNADQAHVAKVLSRLGLEDCFEGVICFETLNPFNYEDINACDGTGSWSPSYASKSQILDIIEHPCQSNPVSALPKSPVVCKPFEDAFEQAFKLANINPQKTVFFDDSVRNIMTGKLMGLHTVLVGTANRENGADYALESIHNMKEALSDLWKANDKSEARSFTRKVSMETTAQREGDGDGDGDGEGEEACKLIVILCCLERELNWENMAKRELSSTLKNLKFMQRAVQREEKTKKQEEEVKPDGNFFSPGTIKKCVVVMEGDPHPGAVLGRMSFQSFNPSVDKLNEAAANEASDARASTSSHQSGRTSFRENESSPEGLECSNTAKPSSEANGDHKRKQYEVASEIQHQNKSPKMVQDGHQSSPNSSKGSFKQPKRGKLDWNVLRPKSQHNQNKRG
ncbi:hypothetical protein H0E87_017911 [Populus deltoides]|uniref:Uncharacterized protein n=1 Tax=Populus deltoides TaxID=3696 RepID=A0A8T2Y2B5_POPDE|nr:hypothetical protein H0E87_017911 [Populus deltoides]